MPDFKKTDFTFNLNEKVFNKNCNHSTYKCDIARVLLNDSALKSNDIKFNSADINTLKEKAKTILEEKANFFKGKLKNLINESSQEVNKDKVISQSGVDKAIINKIYEKLSCKEKSFLDDLTFFANEKHACRELEFLFKGIITAKSSDSDSSSKDNYNANSINLTNKFISRLGEDSKKVTLSAIYHRHDTWDWMVSKQLTKTAEQQIIQNVLSLHEDIITKFSEYLKERNYSESETQSMVSKLKELKKTCEKRQYNEITPYLNGLVDIHKNNKIKEIRENIDLFQDNAIKLKNAYSNKITQIEELQSKKEKFEYDLINIRNELIILKKEINFDTKILNDEHKNSVFRDIGFGELANTFKIQFQYDHKNNLNTKDIIEKLNDLEQEISKEIVVINKEISSLENDKAKFAAKFSELVSKMGLNLNIQENLEKIQGGFNNIQTDYVKELDEILDNSKIGSVDEIKDAVQGFFRKFLCYGLSSLVGVLVGGALGVLVIPVLFSSLPWFVTAGIGATFGFGIALAYENVRSKHVQLNVKNDPYTKTQTVEDSVRILKEIDEMILDAEISNKEIEEKLNKYDTNILSYKSQYDYLISSNSQYKKITKEFRESFKQKNALEIQLNFLNIYLNATFNSTVSCEFKFIIRELFIKCYKKCATKDFFDSYVTATLNKLQVNSNEQVFIKELFSFIENILSLSFENNGDKTLNNLLICSTILRNKNKTLNIKDYLPEEMYNKLSSLKDKWDIINQNLIFNFTSLDFEAPKKSLDSKILKDDFKNLNNEYNRLYTERNKFTNMAFRENVQKKRLSKEFCNILIKNRAFNDIDLKKQNKDFALAVTNYNKNLLKYNNDLEILNQQGIVRFDVEKHINIIEEELSSINLFLSVFQKFEKNIKLIENLNILKSRFEETKNKKKNIFNSIQASNLSQSLQDLNSLLQNVKDILKDCNELNLLIKIEVKNLAKDFSSTVIIANDYDLIFNMHKSLSTFKNYFNKNKPYISFLNKIYSEMQSFEKINFSSIISFIESKYNSKLVSMSEEGKKALVESFEVFNNFLKNKEKIEELHKASKDDSFKYILEKLLNSWKIELENLNSGESELFKNLFREFKFEIPTSRVLITPQKDSSIINDSRIEPKIFSINKKINLDNTYEEIFINFLNGFDLDNEEAKKSLSINNIPTEQDIVKINNNLKGYYNYIAQMALADGSNKVYGAPSVTTIQGLARGLLVHLRVNFIDEKSLLATFDKFYKDNYDKESSKELKKILEDNYSYSRSLGKDLLESNYSRYLQTKDYKNINKITNIFILLQDFVTHITQDESLKHSIKDCIHSVWGKRVDCKKLDINQDLFINVDIVKDIMQYGINPSVSDEKSSNHIVDFEKMLANWQERLDNDEIFSSDDNLRISLTQASTLLMMINDKREVAHQGAFIKNSNISQKGLQRALNCFLKDSRLFLEYLEKKEKVSKTSQTETMLKNYIVRLLNKLQAIILVKETSSGKASAPHLESENSTNVALIVRPNDWFGVWIKGETDRYIEKNLNKLLGKYKETKFIDTSINNFTNICQEFNQDLFNFEANGKKINSFFDYFEECEKIVNESIKDEISFVNTSKNFSNVLDKAILFSTKLAIFLKRELFIERNNSIIEFDMDEQINIKISKIWEKAHSFFNGKELNITFEEKQLIMLIPVFIKEIFNSEFVKKFKFSKINDSDLPSYFKNDKIRILNQDTINALKYQVLSKDKKCDTSLFNKFFDLQILTDVLKNKNFSETIKIVDSVKQCA